MDFYELKNKYFSLVRKKMINDYKMGNIDFMESEELLDHIIERIGMYQDHGKSDDESIASAFRDFHGKLLALRPLTLGYTVGASYDGQSTIPGAEYVSVFRGLVGTEFADESMATKFAERDGVKLIFGFPPIPNGLYVDTEKNRKIIEEYLNSVFGKIKLLQKAPCDQIMNCAFLCDSRALILLSTTTVDKWDDVNNAHQCRRSPCCLHHSTLSAKLLTRGEIDWLYNY